LGDEEWRDLELRVDSGELRVYSEGIGNGELKVES
jgi:hypothetical protein